MKIKKLAALLLAALMVSGSMAACSNSPQSSSSGSESGKEISETSTGEKEVLEFYHGYYHDEASWAPAAVMREIYDKFAEEHKDGPVTFKPIPMENHLEFVNQKVAGGEYPDCVDLAGTAVSMAAISQGLVYDMKPYIDSEGIKEQVGINYEQNLVDGKIYTVHDQLLTLGYWYNEKIFKDAGATLPNDMKTWDDFKTAMETIRKNDSGIYAYGSGQGCGNMFNAALALTDKGKELLGKTELTAEDIQSEEFKNAFLTVGNLEHDNGSEFTSASNDVSTDFNEGKCAMFANGVWASGSFAEVENIRPAVYPGNTAISSAGGGITIASGMSEAKTQLALEFVKYMTSAEVQQRIFLEVGANPCNPTLDLNKLAEESGDKTAILLAEACSMANDADHVVPSTSNWGNDIVTLINNKLTECGVSSSDVNAKYDELKNELIAIIS